MATLILTAVGTVVGGPIGGAIGAVIGQQIDAVIFAPKPRKGPRLGELIVQTSTYGSPLPKIFGRMRVAGTVIWATDLQEHRSSSGGGKGRAGTISYSYSASFAVALAGNPIGGVGRIWADGKLLRGAAGDFKTETGFRLYLGDEEQDVDPLIASTEGIGSTPAYRGLAYAVFEDFQLADYGNRIPSLSFEVEAQAEPVSIGRIAEALSGGEIVAGETPTLSGYAATGDSIRGALEGLAGLVPLSLVEQDDVLALVSQVVPTIAIDSAEAGARASDAGGKTEIVRRAASAVPSEISIAYYEPARDWQTGVQRATTGERDARLESIALPAALEAEAAKAMAEARLAMLRAARASATVNLGWRWSELRPGMLVELGGERGSWKIERWTLHQMIATLELVRVAAGSAPNGAGAAPGRVLREGDLLHGPTVLRLLDIPLSLDANTDRAHLLVAAAGPEVGWRRAQLSASFDGGASWQGAGQTAPPSVIGTAVTALADSGSALIDDRGSVEIELLNDALWLESRNDAALVNGANLALLGEELIQFGRVEPLGDRHFRLSRFLRGRRGTEWAALGHAVGEPFILIDANALARIDVSTSQLGAEVRVLAQGIGDDLSGVTANRLVLGESLRPPSLVHLRVRAGSDGGLAISWVRRSRSGWSWLDGSDTPLAEESERYELRLTGSAMTQTLMLGETGYYYSAAEQEGDGGGPLSIEVVQIGTVVPSRPATLTVERP